MGDPALQKALTPDYTIGCKRIILSSTLYPALDQPHVTVHTKDDGIAEINETGIRTTQGEQVDVDLIVYATGYCATDGVISYPVEGRDGRSLANQWQAYPRAYLGTSLPGFPNLFIMTGPNTGIGHTSAIFIIEAQLNYVAKAIKQVLKGGHQTVEVTEEAEVEYTEMIHREMEGKRLWKSGGLQQLVSKQERSRDRNVPRLFLYVPAHGERFSNADITVLQTHPRPRQLPATAAN